MEKLRIIKKEVTDDNGKSKVHYEIQKKFLFFWIPKIVKTHYYTHTDWNDMPVHGAMLRRCQFLYNSEEQAKEYLNKLLNPFKESYKGCNIVRYFDDSDWSDVYINRGCRRYWNDGFCFEYSNTLETLKTAINERKRKRKISIVG